MVRYLYLEFNGKPALEKILFRHDRLEFHSREFNLRVEVSCSNPHD